MLPHTRIIITSIIRFFKQALS